MSARVITACAGLALLATGCLPEAARTTANDRTDEASADRFAVVELSAVHPRTMSDSGMPTNVQAHFLEARGVAPDAVFDALDVWVPNESAGCVIVHPPASAGSLDAEVTLLDAGSVGVSGNGAAVRLRPRAVPAYIPQFRGVVYGAEQAGPPTYAHDEPYLVWADGGDVPSFAVGVHAPAPVEWVDVNGVEPGSAMSLGYAPGDGVDVAFVSDAATVFVTLRSAADLDAPRIECRLDGQQRLAIDPADLDGVFGDDARLELTARTVRVQPLGAEVGFDGVVTYSFVDRVELVPSDAPRP